MTIGYINPGYPVLRTIVNKCTEARYVRVRSFDSMAARVLSAVNLSSFPAISRRLKRSAFTGGISENFERIDLFHFFNNIALPPCRAPYVTTFETTVPRSFEQGRMMLRGLDSLLSNQCRRLIALSEHAKRRQMAYDAENGISELDKKITVLLPPQERLCAENDLWARQAGRGVVTKIIFVGKDFFRKGGAEAVRALAKIREDFEVEAFLVGDFHHVDYASSWEVDSAEEMRRLFFENADWLHHYKSMPNGKVLALAQTCHIGLLPTRDDTFGYSVLEFQSCGLPCITTNIRALPEINNDEIGWLVQVPKLANGCADFSTTEKMRELSRAIERGLCKMLQEALAKPETIFTKGIKAQKNLAANHSPERYGKRLGEIYEEAVR